METMTRRESDSIGTLDVPADVYYGVQTLRGARNFQITGHTVDMQLILNVVRIKKASALANRAGGGLSEKHCDAIVRACDEVLSGKFADAFITDEVQGGAGTTTNMNVNEVIANRATEILGGTKGSYLCHPNDHVNRAQSTNDVIPTAGKLTVLDYTKYLDGKLTELIKALEERAAEFDDVLKMGRTQLQDAVPIRLGQEFRAYVSALRRCQGRLKFIREEMSSLNIGGTAIGTAVNTDACYLKCIVEKLSEVTGYKLTAMEDRIDGTQNLDGFVFVSGIVKSLAVALSKMSNDLRLMSSGPRTGLSEITLPPMQNGSSIMPGKVNPVIPEVVSQAAFLAIGNDTAITMAAEAGQLELNAFEPVLFAKLFESFAALANAMDTLTRNCIRGITANRSRCEELLMNSVGIVTALCPHIGYKRSAELAKKAIKENIPIRTLILQEKVMEKEELDKVLDPFAMTEPPKGC